MDMDQRIFWQEEIERKYNKKHIDGYIRQEILDNPVMVDKINQGVALLEEYRSKTYSYQSKNARIAQLQSLDLYELTISVFIGIAYCVKEVLFTSITAQMAGRLKFSDKKDGITTIAEIVAVLCNTDAFDIKKAHRMASLTLISRIPLSENLLEFIDNATVLPPMVCQPKQLMNNYTSGYLTHDDSLILGHGNHHDGDICLDVLNLMNQVELKLDTQFLSSVEEQPTFEIDTPEKREQWGDFKRHSYKFYLMLAKVGNHFYLTHKVDKRGRIYACGYHVTTQGTAFKKASIELAKEEYIDVPREFRL